MFNFEIYRNDVLICVGGGYDSIESARNRINTIMKERDCNKAILLKKLNGKEILIETI